MKNKRLCLCEFEKSKGVCCGCERKPLTFDLGIFVGFVALTCASLSLKSPHPIFQPAEDIPPSRGLSAFVTVHEVHFCRAAVTKPLVRDLIVVEVSSPTAKKVLGQSCNSFLDQRSRKSYDFEHRNHFCSVDEPLRTRATISWRGMQTNYFFFHCGPPPPVTKRVAHRKGPRARWCLISCNWRIICYLCSWTIQPAPKTWKESQRNETTNLFRWESYA